MKKDWKSMTDEEFMKHIEEEYGNFVTTNRLEAEMNELFAPYYVENYSLNYNWLLYVDTHTRRKIERILNKLQDKYKDQRFMWMIWEEEKEGVISYYIECPDAPTGEDMGYELDAFMKYDYKVKKENDKPFNIKNILDSLRDDVISGKMTLKDAAKELYKGGWLYYPTDYKKAKRLLKLENKLIKESKSQTIKVGKDYDLVKAGNEYAIFAKRVSAYVVYGTKAQMQQRFNSLEKVREERIKKEATEHIKMDLEKVITDLIKKPFADEIRYHAAQVMWNRDIDESYANGLWDFAQDLTNSVLDIEYLSDADYETVWNEVYYGLWDRAEVIAEALLDTIDDKLFDALDLINKELGFNVDLKQVEQSQLWIDLREIYFEYFRDIMNNK